MHFSPVVLATVFAHAANAQFATTPDRQVGWYGAFDIIAVSREADSDAVFARSIIPDQPLDLDGDGETDQIPVDADMDGMTDQTTVDADMDGEPDVDEDGNVIMVDVTEDLLGNVVGDEVIAGAGLLDLDFTIGGRLTIGRRNCNYGFEGSYLTTNNAREAFEIVGGPFAPGNLDPGTQIDPAAGSNIVAVSGDIASEFSTAEFYVYHLVQTTSVGEGFFLYGVRYLGVSDRLNVALTDADGGVVSSNTTTDNRIFGPQLGLVTTGRLGNGSLRAVAKGTLGFNSIDKSFDNGAFEINNRSQVSGIGNIAIEYEYSPFYNFAIRGGYELMYVSDLALGIDNFAQSTSVETSALFHMPYLGIVAKY